MKLGLVNIIRKTFLESGTTALYIQYITCEERCYIEINTLFLFDYHELENRFLVCSSVSKKSNRLQNVQSFHQKVYKLHEAAVTILEN